MLPVPNATARVAPKPYSSPEIEHRMTSMPLYSFHYKKLTEAAANQIEMLPVPNAATRVAPKPYSSPAIEHQMTSMSLQLFHTKKRIYNIHDEILYYYRKLRLLLILYRL